MIVELDKKNRITLKDSEYEYYNIKHYSNGKIELSPRVLIDPRRSQRNEN
jgi:hypothetical protein